MSTPPADLLEWDSNFFGVRIGRVRPGHFLPNEVDAWRRENHIRCLYYLAELDDTPSIHAAEEMGFHLMDIRTTFFTTLPVQPIGLSVPAIRRARPTDLADLQAMTANSFIYSRFYHDPHFSREKCDELYAIWVEKQLNDPKTLVWVTDDERGATGFVTVLDLDADSTSISLIGIAERARGRGLGKALVNHVLVERGRQGFTRFEVVTQAANPVAMKLYQACNLRVTLQQAWLHGWFE